MTVEIMFEAGTFGYILKWLKENLEKENYEVKCGRYEHSAPDRYIFKREEDAVWFKMVWG